jgi:hypothetical protein
MRSYTTTHATRTAHSTRRERMLSLLFRNNSSLSARYVRVRPATVALHAPDVYNSFKVLDAYNSPQIVRYMRQRRQHTTVVSLAGDKDMRRKIKILKIFVSSHKSQKDALCHRPNQPAQWRECPLNPKPGSHDELGQAIIPFLLETWREYIRVRISLSLAGCVHVCVCLRETAIARCRARATERERASDRERHFFLLNCCLCSCLGHI